MLALLRFLLTSEIKEKIPPYVELDNYICYGDEFKQKAKFKPDEFMKFITCVLGLYSSHFASKLFLPAFRISSPLLNLIELRRSVLLKASQAIHTS